MKIKSIALAVALTITLIGSGYLTAYAEDQTQSSSSNPLFSRGRVTFSNGTESVSVDTSDLYNLRTAIEELETKYDTGIVTALSSIGTDITTEDPTFEELMTGIVNSQSVKDEHTAMIENNLSAGYAGWVNGTYVVGNGKDNDDAYNRGYADGMANINNGRIVYTYHKHSDSCIRKCRVTYDVTVKYGNGLCNVNIVHHECGQSSQFLIGVPYTGQSTEYHDYYICGKTEQTIESATIVFN